MSYDDQQSFRPASSSLFSAYTPMILDMIALQQAYSEGAGTGGIGNDTIATGIAGYRTYFDKGGIDTIDLSSYADGAYLQMGANIAGSAHKVAVPMNACDAEDNFLFRRGPQWQRHIRFKPTIQRNTRALPGR